MPPFQVTVTINGISRGYTVDKDGYSGWIKAEDFGLKIFAKGTKVNAVRADIELPDDWMRKVANRLNGEYRQIKLVYVDFDIPPDAKTVIISRMRDE